MEEQLETLGGTLRQEREKRGISLGEVHEATKISARNLSALEEDRFDYFPNRVYARAFLRDYANYLSLDSGELLDRYEAEWGKPQEPEPVIAPRVSGWRVFGYALLAVLIVAGLAGAAYFGWTGREKKASLHIFERPAPSAPAKEEVATVPRVEPVPASPPEVAAEPEQPAATESKPAEPAKPEQPAKPVEKLSLQVKTQQWNVWTKVVTDGRIHIQTIPPWTTRTFEAANKISIEVGLAKGIRLILNDKPQPSMGTHSGYAKKEFIIPANPAPAGTSAPG